MEFCKSKNDVHSKNSKNSADPIINQIRNNEFQVI